LSYGTDSYQEKKQDDPIFHAIHFNATLIPEGQHLIFTSQPSKKVVSSSSESIPNLLIFRLMLGDTVELIHRLISLQGLRYILLSSYQA